MKKNKTIYWISTGLLGAFMLFSAYSYFANPQIAAGFKHLGFNDYFRKELGIAKFLGALILLIPQLPARIKEWAYAGFAITFISASIAHFNSGDAASMIMMPVIFLLVLIVSNIYFHKSTLAVARN